MWSGVIRSGSGRCGMQSVCCLSAEAWVFALTWRVVLTAALENSSDSLAAAKAVRKLKHESRICDLEKAKKLATYRSGARGLKARKELRLMEEALSASLKSWVFSGMGCLFMLLMDGWEIGWNWMRMRLMEALLQRRLRKLCICFMISRHP